MPFSANGTDFIIEGTAGVANANGSFRNVYYSGSISLYGYSGPTNFGYTSGGESSGNDNNIDRFPFALSITNATDVGDLTVSRYGGAGQSSTTHGYTSGGSPTVNIIDRFPFALSITNATDVGDRTLARMLVSGQSSTTHGYSSGGETPAISNVIDRFPFALSITNATDVGDMTQTKSRMAGQSSSENGYNSGGFVGEGGYNTIERFPFALSITNAADVGDLILSFVFEGSGQSSTTHGYSSGGYTSPGEGLLSNVIQRWPFALSITNATDVGDLTGERWGLAGGQSSTTFGYSSGGYTPGGLDSNVVVRFPFALSITNSSDVGDLTLDRAYTAGQQY